MRRVVSILTLAVSCRFVVLAESALPHMTNVTAYAAQTGGILVKPGNGRVLLVSNQKRFGAEDLKHLAASFSDQLRATVDCADDVPFAIGTAKLEMERLDAQVAVFLVDVQNTPMSLVSLEERWAAVNVARLDLTSNGHKNLFRLKREVSRVLKAVFSGVSWKKDVKAVATGGDLDGITADPIDGESLVRIVHGLPSYGITSSRLVTYRRACEEGWAPPPTNEFQRAIWEKVHAIPDKPLKIEYDAGRGR